jgi:hypothetical protein
MSCSIIRSRGLSSLVDRGVSVFSDVGSAGPSGCSTALVSMVRKGSSKEGQGVLLLELYSDIIAVLVVGMY